MKNEIDKAQVLVENTNRSPAGYDYDLRSDVSNFICNKLRELDKSSNWLAHKLDIPQRQLDRIMSGIDMLDTLLIARIYYHLGQKPVIIPMTTVFQNKEIK